MLEAGDRVYRWVWTGGETQEPLVGTVVRVNRVTVTVRDDSGNVLRIPPDDLSRVDWDES